MLKNFFLTEVCHQTEVSMTSGAMTAPPRWENSEWSLQTAALSLH